MLIGVDASCWGNKRGFGRFTRDLLEAVLEVDQANEYLFVVDSETARTNDLPAAAKVEVAKTDVSPVTAAAADGRRSIRDLWAMSRAVYRHKIDVFFFPAVYSYFPVLNRTKMVLTVHDVIADHHPTLVFPNARSKAFWKLKQKMAIGQANIITTVSEYSKKEIINYFRLPESSLRVISEAARPMFAEVAKNNGFVAALERYHLRQDERFLLYVGGISPHKNLKTLIDAFKIVSENDDALKLVLVGDYKDDPFFSAYPSLKEQITAHGLNDRAIFTGYVSDKDLVYLYNAATLLVFPSFEEGFGLPAIEAMACGTPVAASNAGSLPEVLGPAGRYFDPLKPEEMAGVISALVIDEPTRAKMKADGLDRSKQFRWKRAAEETIAIFNEVGGK